MNAYIKVPPMLEADLALPAEGLNVELVTDLIATHGPFQMTKIGIVVEEGVDPSFDEWSAATEWAQKTEKASTWWVGDLIEFGEHRFGEKYSQVLDATGYAKQTLQGMSYVSRQIAPSRRRKDLSFALHREVAPLPPAEQDEWLDRCENDNLTREQLRAQIRASKATAARNPVEFCVVVTCTDVDHQMKLADELRARGHAVKMIAKGE
jgi:hypothetical protein